MNRPVRRYQGGGLHVSASSLRVLMECPRQFFLQYIRGLPREQISGRMILGTAIHSALEVFYTALMVGSSEPGLNQLVGIAVKRLKAEFSGPVLIELKEGEDQKALTAECTRILSAFLEEPYRPHKVLGVEAPFGIALVDPDTATKLFDEVVVGFFDLVVQEPDGSVAIVDHKVTARMAVPKCTSMDVQLGMYGWAGDQLFGNARPVRLRHHVLVRNKKSIRTDVVDIPRAAGDATEAFEAICSGIELIHVSVGHPRPEALLGRHRSWRCSGCAYKERCDKSHMR